MYASYNFRCNRNSTLTVNDYNSEGMQCLWACNKSSLYGNRSFIKIDGRSPCSSDVRTFCSRRTAPAVSIAPLKRCMKEWEHRLRLKAFTDERVIENMVVVELEWWLLFLFCFITFFIKSVCFQLGKVVYGPVLHCNIKYLFEGLCFQKKMNDCKLKNKQSCCSNMIAYDKHPFGPKETDYFFANLWRAFIGIVESRI